MRVRYEMCSNGAGRGERVECDMTPKAARKLFDTLKKDALCGWCELVAEEDEEGGYMEVIETDDKYDTACFLSKMFPLAR